MHAVTQEESDPISSLSLPLPSSIPPSLPPSLFLSFPSSLSLPPSVPPPPSLHQ